MAAVTITVLRLIASLSKTKLYAGNPSKATRYSSSKYGSNNPIRHGGNPQERLIVENWSEHLECNKQTDQLRLKSSETKRLEFEMDLQAQWIVGFVEAQGSFHVSVNRHKEKTVGYQVLPEFTVVQHKRDVQVLYALKAFFGCGVVRKNTFNRMAYRVRGIEHLTETIIPFFEKHTLKTKKGIEFQKFRKVLLKIKRGDHLKTDGIEEIRNLKNQMHRLQHQEKQCKVVS